MGNRWTHREDGVADAQLYQGKAKRSNPSHFQKLYKLSPTFVANVSM